MSCNIQSLKQEITNTRKKISLAQSAKEDDEIVLRTQKQLIENLKEDHQFLQLEFQREIKDCEKQLELHDSTKNQFESKCKSWRDPFVLRLRTAKSELVSLRMRSFGSSEEETPENAQVNTEKEQRLEAQIAQQQKEYKEKIEEMKMEREQLEAKRLELQGDLEKVKKRQANSLKIFEQTLSEKESSLVNTLREIKTAEEKIESSQRKLQDLMAQLSIAEQAEKFSNVFDSDPFAKPQAVQSSSVVAGQPITPALQNAMKIAEPINLEEINVKKLSLDK